MRTRTQRGFTLTELLVVLAIIGLLATMAIPVYLTRMEGARIRTAQAEVQEIANAMETCAIFHGFYPPIQLLDDIATEDDPTRPVTTDPPPDSLGNELTGAIYLVDPFRRATQQLSFANPNLTPGAIGQWRLGDYNSSARVSELIMGWQGPFLNTQRVYQVPDRLSPTSFDKVRHDFPLDPWGQPYRFFSPIGPIGQHWDLDPANDDMFSDGKIIAATSTNQDPFDRYAVVSFGPNGVIGPLGSDNDDISYQFGMVFTATVFYRYFRTH